MPKYVCLERLKITGLRNLGFTCIFLFSVDGVAGGSAVTGQAGSIRWTLVSRSYNFSVKICPQVCLNLNMACLVFSSTCSTNWKAQICKYPQQDEPYNIVQSCSFFMSLNEHSSCQQSWSIFTIWNNTHLTMPKIYTPSLVLIGSRQHEVSTRTAQYSCDPYQLWS